MDCGLFYGLFLWTFLMIGKSDHEHGKNNPNSWTAGMLLIFLFVSLSAQRYICCLNLWFVTFPADMLFHTFPFPESHFYIVTGNFPQLSIVMQHIKKYFVWEYFVLQKKCIHFFYIRIVSWYSMQQPQKWKVKPQNNMKIAFGLD